MEKILEVKNLCKTYPEFQLQNISFCVERGMIMQVKILNLKKAGSIM